MRTNDVWPAELEAPTSAGPTRNPEGDVGGITRRSFVRGLGAGTATVLVIGAGGLTWRAVDQGVFSTGEGPAYAAWDAWNPPGQDQLDLVRAAVLAANAHNTQPWLFTLAPGRIDLFADTTRTMGTMDPLRREMELSLGCALENLVLAGPPNGWSAEVTLMPDPSDRAHVARVALAPTEGVSSPLFRAIPDRHTNRAAYDDGRSLPAQTLDGLQGLMDVPDTEVVWFTRAEDRAAFGNLTVRATEAIIADRQQATDDFAWYRGTWSEIQSKKDGITIDATGQPPIIRTVAKLFGTSQQQNDDGWLRATRDTQLPTAAAFGTLVVRDPLDTAQRLETGRVYQRMHLWATTEGLAMQPLNQIEERIDREQTAGLEPGLTNAMSAMVPSGWHSVMSFRIGYPTADALLSPRRPAEDVASG